MPYKGKKAREYYQNHEEDWRQYAQENRVHIREYCKQWRKTRRTTGLCMNCNRKAILGHTRCAIHLFKSAFSARKHYEEHRNHKLEYLEKRQQSRLIEGKCFTCGAPLIEDESKYCFACKSRPRRQVLIKGVLKYETAS